MSTPSTDSDQRAKAIADANALLTGSAKWLITALGAIGAVLVAGSQLSSLGSLPVGPRFTAAIVGLGVGLLGVLWAILTVLATIAPPRYTISELAEEWAAAGATAAVLDQNAASTAGAAGAWKRYRHPVVDWLARHPEHLAGQDSPGQLLEHWTRSEATGAEDRAAALGAINDMTQLANYLRARSRFVRMRLPVAVAIMVAAAGISVFAWAANPAASPSPSLRNASLIGADLSGAALSHADLTGADLTRADLTGANLTGATLTGVTWSATVCPDGTNSDDTAAADGANGSCLGHLSP